MKFSEHLRKTFPDTDLKVEDLRLLESFQIKDLPKRVPQKEFATLLREYPEIKQYLIEKLPAIQTFILKVLRDHKTVTDQEIIDKHCNEVLWEVGELLIYNKFPETYDSKIKFTWKIEDLMAPHELKGKTIADVGAGSGMLCILLSKYVQTIYAIEPLSSFRNFMHQRFIKENILNVQIKEGFLDRIPLPNHSVDILFTSNALGWNFEHEQKEIERLVKPGGKAIHLMRAFDKNAVSPHHDQLLKWNYTFEELEADGYKAKYIKTE